MPNIIKATVENGAELRNASAYGTSAIVRLQSATVEAGPFANEATVTLDDTTRIFTLYDADGTSSTWYRTRYENGAGTVTSDWSVAFQVGTEAGGLLCSLYDVLQAMGMNSGTNADEDVLSYIRQVTSEIQLYTGRKFVRNPQSGTTTFLFDVGTHTRTLWVPQGIATLSQVEVAQYTGGSFTVVSSADWFLDPPATAREYGWPGTRVTISDLPTGSIPCFYPGKRVVRLTMAEGWDTVPFDIEAIALRASIAAYMSKGSGTGGQAFVGPNGVQVLRNISPADRATLDLYRHMAAA